MTETEIGPIDYLPQEDGDPLFLLTPRQRDRLRLSLREAQARLDLLTPEAPKGKKRPPKPAPEGEAATAALRDRALVLEMEVLNDDLLRTVRSGQVRTARFKTEPDDGLGDCMARIEARRMAERLKAALPEEELQGAPLTPDETDALYYEASYRVLKPAPVEGWEGEVPPSLRYLLGSECHRKLFPEQYRSERAAVMLMEHAERQEAKKAKAAAG